MDRHIPTESDARQALRDHLIEKATSARSRSGPIIDGAGILRVLADLGAVRYPVQLGFSAARLLPGEFAFAEQLAEHPSAGFRLHVHPCFETHRELWPAIIAYHIPPINYGEVVSEEDCEAFASTLLGMGRDEYYTLICRLADSVPSSDDGHPSNASQVGPDRRLAWLRICANKKTPAIAGAFKRGGRDSNPQPPDRQSGTLTN